MDKRTLVITGLAVGALAVVGGYLYRLLNAPDYVTIKKLSQRISVLNLQLRGGQETQSRVLESLDKLNASALESLDECRSASSPEALDVSMEVFSGLARFWWMRGHTKNVTLHMDYFDKVDLGKSKKAADVLYGCGMLFYALADYEKSRKNYEKALEIFQTIDSTLGVADCLNGIGMVHREQAQYDLAKKRHEASLELYQTIGDKWGIAHSLSNIGVVMYRSGKPELATEFHEKALKLRREISDTVGISSSLGNLAVLGLTSDIQTSQKYYTESLELRKELGDIWGVAGSNVQLAKINLKLNLPSESKKNFIECFNLFLQVGDNLGICETLEGLAELFFQLKEYVPCSLILGAAKISRERIHSPIPTSHVQDQKKMMEFLSSQECFGKNFERGKKMTQPEIEILIRELLC